MGDTMDLRRLRTFVAVAEEGSVSRAAVRLHITQPALSRQIRDLEAELDIRLFDRAGRGVALTSAGENLLADCRSLLVHASLIGERAQLLRRGDSGLLKVAASPVQIEGVLSGFLHRYARRYPNVQVKVIEAVGPDILNMLQRGETHLGILLNAVHADVRQFDRLPVPPVELLAAFRPAFPIKRGNRIDVTMLSAHPLLLLDTGFVVRRTFDAVCRIAGITPNVLIESRAPSNLLALAEAGHGIAIIPSVVPTHRYELRVARVTHEQKPIREPLAVVWDKRRHLPRYAHEFSELLAAHMREHLTHPRQSTPTRLAGKSRGQKPNRF